ncbi:AP complex sigma like protein [Babesia gibsoni]|uniref:AP complex subunit sigma n=1 Tax=Babesia gibsoni TaxID=33632 RepID=A0AAD8UVP7_BABGI|nr:AP complex sigma like protein [Babesia gibsoni]
MIYGVFIQNIKNDACISKWYHHFTKEEKRRIPELIHSEIVVRSTRWVNFFELEGRKVIYRRYANVLIILYTDLEDNTPSYHELIHLIVAVVDNFYGNINELDLFCNFNTLHNILNEFILAGELLDVSMETILDRLRITYRMD